MSSISINTLLAGLNPAAVQPRGAGPDRTPNHGDNADGSISRGPSAIVEITGTHPAETPGEPDTEDQTNDQENPTPAGAAPERTTDSSHTKDTDSATTAETDNTATDESQSPAGQKLTEQEQAQVDELKERDREVRRHEAAHKGAAGGFAKGGPTYSYQQGPDGKRYAVGGEVQIDTSSVPGDPAATIRKMQTIQRAAAAPADPSSQDRAVAAQAARAEQNARQELRAQQAEKTEAASSAPEGNAESSKRQASSETDRGSETPTVTHNATNAGTDPNADIGRLIDIAA